MRDKPERWEDWLLWRHERDFGTPDRVWIDPQEWWHSHNLRGRGQRGAKRFIYFLQDSDTVKIGEANNADKRIASLKTANLRLVEIGRVLSHGVRDTELHHWLSEWRIDPDREFFRLDQPVKDWIAESLSIGCLAIPPDWERTYAKATSMCDLSEQR